MYFLPSNKNKACYHSNIRTITWDISPHICEIKQQHITFDSLNIMHNSWFRETLETNDGAITSEKKRLTLSHGTSSMWEMERSPCSRGRSSLWRWVVNRRNKVVAMRTKTITTKRKTTLNRTCNPRQLNVKMRSSWMFFSGIYANHPSCLC